MAKEEFFRDIRRAATLVRPKVQTDSERLAPEGVARRLERAALWLTPKYVEAYAADDFADLPSAVRDSIRDAVEGFATAARQVSPNDSATDDQFRAGSERFRRLSAIVGDVVRSEWIAAVEGLVAAARSWSEKRDWTCRLSTKQLQETLLGEYSLPQLYIHAGDAPLLLDPVARFVPGALGLVDFAVLSPYRSMMVPRTRDGWFLHLETGKDINGVRREPWAQEAFYRAVEHLARQRG
jgi:hypothetical protein